jgi:two-component system, cell cycle response regulator
MEMPMRILIAEDDSTSRTILTAVLTKQGYEVMATKNGAEAWDIMRKPDAPKLAILDWMMPQMDGVEICRRIRTMETNEPPHIIMLTAKTEKVDIITALDAGADDYLTKPFDHGELRARVNVGRRMLELQTKLHATNIALAYEAMHDSLTGVHNRRALLDSLSRELAREERQHEGLAIGICDIDHFKEINDAHGHLMGDEVLCGIAHLLEKSLRRYDFLGRFGGEEFIVITPEIKESDVGMLYERFRTAVADNPVITKAGNLSATISIGVAMWIEGESVDELLMAADSALYQAKGEGRNRVCLTDRRIIRKK